MPRPIYHPTATFRCGDCARPTRVPADHFRARALEIRADQPTATDATVAASFSWCTECLTDAPREGEHDLTTTTPEGVT